MLSHLMVDRVQFLREPVSSSNDGSIYGISVGSVVYRTNQDGSEKYVVIKIIWLVDRRKAAFHCLKLENADSTMFVKNNNVKSLQRSAYVINLKPYRVFYYPQIQLSDDRISVKDMNSLMNKLSSKNKNEPEMLVYVGKGARKVTIGKKSAAAEKFVVVDRAFTDSMGICPACNSRIYLGKYNIPAYDSENNFAGYYLSNGYHCQKCQKFMIQLKDFHDLVRRVATTHKDRYVVPDNMNRRYDTISQGYLYQPIVDDVYIRVNSTRVVVGSEVGRESVEAMQLNDASFLYAMGYNVNVSQTERREVLNRAVERYGKRKVSDHIRFLIHTRKGQANGKEKFSFALGVWRDDLNYISSVGRVKHKPALKKK